MSRVAQQARNWIGTPYKHRASVRGAGTDCLGLVLGVWRELGGVPVQEMPVYAPGWQECCPQERLWQELQAQLNPSERQILPGQVALLRMRDGAAARHLGILSGTWRSPRLVHAYSGRGVVESILAKPLRRRIVARFRLPLEVETWRQ